MPGFSVLSAKFAEFLSGFTGFTLLFLYGVIGCTALFLLFSYYYIMAAAHGGWRVVRRARTLRHIRKADALPMPVDPDGLQYLSQNQKAPDEEHSLGDAVVDKGHGPVVGVGDQQGEHYQTHGQIDVGQR